MGSRKKSLTPESKVCMNCAKFHDGNDDMCPVVVALVQKYEDPMLVFDMHCSDFSQDIPGGQG